MLCRIFLLFVGMAALTCCTSERPEIQAVCSRDAIGNYVIKWETDRPMDGEVKIYVSTDPDHFDLSNPALVTNISKGITTFITSDNITQNYFLLLFNNQYKKIIGSRGLSMDNVQNLRDMGGYPAAAGRRAVRWGKVYRSGSLANLSERDSVRLSKLGLKTIIYLGSSCKASRQSVQFGTAKVLHFPVIPMEEDAGIIPQKLREGSMHKGDAVLFMQDRYIRYTAENKEAFALALEIFQHKDNYPILFSCSLGKDHAGFLAALLLAALDVPEEMIIRDYTASNDYIKVESLSYLAKGLSAEAQEAVTVLISSQETFIVPALQKMKKEHGSIEKFLSKELNLTDKKRQHLKELLLY